MSNPALDRYVSEPFEHQVALDSFWSRYAPMIVADIGAANGFDSVRYAVRFPGTKIIAFEPEEKNYRELMLNSAPYHQISCYNIALGDFNSDEVDFYISDGYPDDFCREENRGNKSSSLLAPKDHIIRWPWIKFEKKKAVVRRFDALGIAVPEFIHMDVQGVELNVLQGFGECLVGVKGVWMEVSRVKLYEGQPLYPEVIQFMHAHGFALKSDCVCDFTGNQFYERA